MAVNEYYKYITDTGIIVPDVSDVQTDVQNEWISLFGSNLDLTASTPQGRIIELQTLARQGTIGICALVANQINIDYATGEFLDAIGAFYNVIRIAATSTRVLATVTGVSGTVIPSGSLAVNESGDVFYAENDITIETSGSATGYFLSQTKGAIQCPINTLNTIRTQVIGWETINNPVSPVIGTEQESDFKYRLRIKDSRYTGTSLVASIKAQLNQVSGVTSTFVYDNGNNEPITYRGVTIAPHSLVAIVDGGSDHVVAEAIFLKISAGCGYTAIPNQSVVEEVIDGSYNVPYTVTFNRPQRVPFDVNITVRQNLYTGDDLERDVKNAILDWAAGLIESVDGLKIGQSVSPFEIGSAVSVKIPSIQIKNCLIALEGGTPAASELVCNINQIYSISESNITVTVVSDE